MFLYVVSASRCEIMKTFIKLDSLGIFILSEILECNISGVRFYQFC